MISWRYGRKTPFRGLDTPWVRIMTNATINAYAAQFPAAASSLRQWQALAKHAEWTSPQSVKGTLANASIITTDRVVFNIQGNSHRLIVRIDCLNGLLFVLWFGTHAAYDDVNAATVTWKPL